MKVVYSKGVENHLNLIPALFVLALSLLATTTSGQTYSAQTGATLASDQQKQLNRLNELTGQLQSDRDAVHSAAAKYGWDSNETDAAQQRLFHDRQEYRTLRRSLQRSGVAVPAEAAGSGVANQNQSNPSGQCGNHGHAEHGCCAGNTGCKEHTGDCCCEGHGT